MQRRGSECRAAGWLQYIRSPPSARTQATRRVVKRRKNPHPLPASGQVKTRRTQSQKFPPSARLFATGRRSAMRALSRRSCRALLPIHSILRPGQRTSPRTDTRRRRRPCPSADVTRITCPCQTHVCRVSITWFFVTTTQPPLRTSAPAVRPSGVTVDRNFCAIHRACLRVYLPTRLACVCACAHHRP